MDHKFIIEVKQHLAPIVPSFLLNCRKKIETAKIALGQHKLDDVRTIGHHFKGAGGGYGFPQISDLGSTIEISAGAGDEEAIAKHLNELSHFLDTIEVVYV
jgi:HPt (histidine-containing phosphotransfer) domain-containing protein